MIELKQRMPNCVTYTDELKKYKFNTKEAFIVDDNPECIDEIINLYNRIYSK